MTRAALAIALGVVLGAAGDLRADEAVPGSENAPTRFVARAAELRARAFQDSRTAAELAVQRAEAGDCGAAVRQRGPRFREILVSADETAARAAAATAVNPGKAAAGYVQADNMLRRLLEAAGTWQCRDTP